MTVRTLIRRSLRFHWRSHLGVVLGAAVGSAALIGALIVGDSVRESLRERALERLGGIHFALDAGDRLFEADLPQRLKSDLSASTVMQILMAPSAAPVFTTPRGRTNSTFTTQTVAFLNLQGSTVIITNRSLTNFIVRPSAGAPVVGTNFFAPFAGVLRASGTAAKSDGTARANQVNVFGINMRLAELDGMRPPMPDEVLLNEALATQLQARAGDTVLLRVRKPEAISAESPVAATDSSVALRLRVMAVVPDSALGNLSLRASQVPPFNAFVALKPLQSSLGVDGRANLVLAGAIEERTSDYRFTWLQKQARRINPRWQWTLPKTLINTNHSSASDGLARLERNLHRSLSLGDLQIELRRLPEYHGLEARSSRIFIEPRLADLLATNGANYVAQRPTRILTYLVNQFRAGQALTPYSMVTATDSPLLPADLRDDEIVINQWLADDLQAGVGTEMALGYFAPDQAAQLLERTNRFRVRAVLPMDHPLCDRTLMPDFPGVAKAEHAGDWETSFPLTHKIRSKDDEYWQKFRSTPKAFISLQAGQSMWANRFGNLTAIRWTFEGSADEATAFWQIRNAEAVLKSAVAKALEESVTATNGGGIPAGAFGFQFQPVREQALTAASQSQDFGGLFIGFSFFLIGAALILMALLFQFGVEQRVAEIGTLLALGFPARRVRKLFLLEGAALAFIGSVVGVAGGILYARAMLHGLTTVWRSATNTSALTFHASPVTLLIGLASGTLVAVITIWCVLRKQARQPARALLAGEVDMVCRPPARLDGNDRHHAGPEAGAPSRFRALLRWLKKPIVIAEFALALAIISALSSTMNPEAFFSAGAFCLIAGLAGTSWFLQRMVGRVAPRAPSD